MLSKDMMKKHKVIRWWFDMALVVAQIMGALDSDLSWIATAVAILRVLARDGAASPRGDAAP